MAERTSDNINRQARDHYNKALAALERNNLDYAIEMFMQCLAIEPNFTKGRQYLRAAQMKRAESSGSFSRMFSAAKLQPLLQKGKMSVTKNPIEAMGMAEQALSVDPKNSQALMLLAEAAEAAKCPEAAIQTLETYAKLNPRDTKALHWQARLCTSINRHEVARDIYERILQSNPNDFEAQKGIKDATAQGAMHGGGWEGAGSYRDVMKDKEEAVALEQASKVVRAEDMIANLIQDNLEKLKRDPDSPVIRRELGRLYAQKGDHEHALQYLETLFSSEAGTDSTLEKEINDIRAQMITAKVQAKKKELAANPNSEAIQQEIAALDREHSELLIKDALNLVERYPNDLMYRYDLGVLYMEVGNTPAAVEQFQKAVGQPQRRISSLNYLGQCFVEMGLHDIAIDQYLKALEELPAMDGVKKEVTYNLATAYEAMGDMDRAIGEYKKIAAVDFGYRDVRTKIVRKPPQKPA
jgi:tetratricopeptide (TPR) repeat protein